MLVHEILLLSLELVEYMSLNPFDLIPALLPLYHSFFLQHELVRSICYHEMSDYSLDLSHVDHMLDMFKENVVDVVLA